MKRFLSVILAIVLALSLSSCGGPERYDVTYTGYFDTVVMLSGYFNSRSDADENFDLIMAEIALYHRLFDAYNDYDEANIKTINDKAGKAPVAIRPELMELLEFSIQAYGITGGRVNIALGSVLKLWHEQREAYYAGDAAVLPNETALREAAKHTNITSLVLDKAACTAYIQDPKMQLDVGAVAKGFAAQKAADSARQRGVNSLIINLGGNVCCIGARPDGAWRVGVQDPDDMEAYIATAQLENVSMVSSGDYQRYYIVDNVRYSHIIDPQTLYPALNYRAVSIVCRDSAWADVLSTALFLMDETEGGALLKKLNAEALWILPDGEMHESAGMAQLLAFSTD